MNGVMIGIITSGDIHMRCAQSLIATTLLGAASSITIQQCGPYLDMGRNKMVNTFLTEEYAHCDRLLFVDSDIAFDPSLIQTLVDDDLPIVSGVYHSLFDQGIRPVVYEWTQKEGEPRLMSPINNWGGRSESDHLVEVEGVGAGFLMIRRDVIERFLEDYQQPQVWFGMDIVDSVELGEDLTFCVRAADLDIPIVVDRRVQVAHHKAIALQGPYASTE